MKVEQKVQKNQMNREPSPRHEEQNSDHVLHALDNCDLRMRPENFRFFDETPLSSTFRSKLDVVCDKADRV